MGNSKLHKILLGVSIGVVVLGVGFPFLIAWIFNKAGYGSYQDFGPIGDWLGGSTTPIFTFGTFLIVVAGYLVQREELKNTKEELALNRKEMELNRVEIQKQTENLTRQGFENTFFKMLSLHNEIVGSMSAPGSTRDRKSVV